MTKLSGSDYLRDTIHGNPIGCGASDKSITLGWLVLGNINSRRYIRHKGTDRKSYQNNYDGVNGWSKAITDEAGEGMALVAQRSDGQVFDQWPSVTVTGGKHKGWVERTGTNR